jgi:hypothetical protein
MTWSWISSSFHNIFIIIMCLVWTYNSLSYEYNTASLFQQYNWSGHSTLSITFNPGVNWLILTAHLAASHHAYKFSVHHWWHIQSFTTIQLHLQAWATDMDFATHRTKLILSIPWLKCILSNHEAFCVL